MRWIYEKKKIICAAAYFDCTKAVLATDGEVLTDAKEVADRKSVV